MQIDTLSFTTYDGKVLKMPDNVFSFEDYGMFGAPPTNYQTRQGYQQQGVTEIAYNLAPREIEIDFYRAKACSRVEYWANREEVLNFFRPNRLGPLVFTVTRVDNSQRSLVVRANPGPQYPANLKSRNDWDVRETLSFTAFDPIWYDPNTVTLNVSSGFDTNLVFPITFPIRFGASGLAFPANITYLGTWKTYPIITLTGPYSSVLIESNAVNASVALITPIAAGDTRIIDLTPGAQSIVDGLGVSKFDELSSSSDLVNFAIVPDPEAAGGVQTLTINMFQGTNGVSAASIRYNSRYFGI